jgi:outer membrane protein assembly factor BamA
MKVASLAFLLIGCSSASLDGNVRVRFDGLHEVSDSALRSVVHVTSASASEREETIKRDELHVLAALYDQGYVEAKVRSSHRAAADATEVTFAVEEGRRYRLRSATLHERDSTTARATLKRTKVGEWFCRSDVVRDLEDARAVYASLGHKDAKIAPAMTLDEAAHALDLDLVIDP